MASERVRLILECIGRLKRGDLRARPDPPVIDDELGMIEAALNELGAAMRDREELVQITQQVAVNNMRRLDELAEELSQARTIQNEQQQIIRTLSTPIIQVWDGVLMMPVLGVVDDRRAERMMQELLHSVADTQCKVAIIDLTGVESVDAPLGNLLVSLVQAVQLLGAQGIIVGMRPEVARTVISDGVDMSRVAVLARLRDALMLCIRHPAAGAVRAL